MIKIEKIGQNIIQISLPQKIEETDFPAIAKEVDVFIQQNGTINLLIDASSFSGWEDSNAIKSHMNFVKEHHHKIHRIALMSGHIWQQWIAQSVGIFLIPEIKIFEKNQIAEAKDWLAN